jgi:hypothetical protein
MIPTQRNALVLQISTSDSKIPRKSQIVPRDPQHTPVPLSPGPWDSADAVVRNELEWHLRQQLFYPPSEPK